MVFDKFVEVGRLVRFNSPYSADAGKVAVVAEIVDHNRVIVDGPTTGVARQVVPIKRLDLVSVKVSLPRGARSKTVKKVLEKESAVAKFKETATYKKFEAKKARADLTDFGRFKVMVRNKKRRAIIKKAIN